MNRLAYLTFAMLAIAAVGAAGARAETLGCAAVVTSDVTLTASLSGCDVGLVVGGDDITIDLAGHSIEAASGGSVGVDVTGRKGVVVENGSIVGFSTGVLVAGSTGASVKSLDVRGADTGIGVFGCLFSDEICSEGNTVSGNTVTGARLAGVVVSGSVGDHVRANNVTRSGYAGIHVGNSQGTVVEDNVARWNETGISISFAPSAVNRNTATDNAFSGISLTRSSVEAGFSRNVANGNGTGIDSFDSHGHYAANVTNANRGRGLVIRDSVFETHGPFFTVSRHVANANGGVGVSVFSGVIDGGGNRARANRAAAQCEYLVCK